MRSGRPVRHRASRPSGTTATHRATTHRTATHRAITRGRSVTARTALAAGLLAALLALSGCGSGSGGRSADRGDARSGQDRAAAAAPEGAGSADTAKSGKHPAAGATAAPKKPGAASATHVIRTATLSVEVQDVPGAVAAARAAATGSGGLVANESTERTDDDHETSRLVLRVPQDGYEAVLRDLAGAGKLLSRTSDAQDVTDQVVDVNSRIATQRTSVARVRALMDRADRLADVVALEGELSTRQAALESLLAQQASLKDRTTMATITLVLTEPDAVAKESEDDPGFLDALGGGWDAFVTLLRWAAMALGAAAPFLGAAVVLLLLVRLVRGRYRKPAAATAGAPVVSAPGSATPDGPDAPAVPAPASAPGTLPSHPPRT
ncbi:DUF4349 domain-containing protein [Streptomyces sp. DT24]|uniref:DUF4349 domain-containing protein n=1 Tax=Streptomyces sp. DT24 TaxID=3416520 RepID=UPI003CEE6141